MSERDPSTAGAAARPPDDRVFRETTRIPHVTAGDDGARFGPTSIATELARLRDGATWQHLFDASAAWRATASMLDDAAAAVTAAARTVAAHWDSDDAAAAQGALRRLVGTARELAGAALETHLFLNTAAEALERAAGQQPPTARLAVTVAADTGQLREGLDGLNVQYRVADAQLPRDVSVELPEIDASSAGGWGTRPDHLAPVRSDRHRHDRHDRFDRFGHPGAGGGPDHLPSRPVVTMPVDPDAPRPLPAPPIQVVATPEHREFLPVTHVGVTSHAVPVGVVTGHGDPPPSTVLSGSAPMMHGGGMSGLGPGIAPPPTNHVGLTGMAADGSLGAVGVHAAEPITMAPADDVEPDPEVEPHHAPEQEFDHWERADRDPFGLRTTAPPPVLE